MIIFTIICCIVFIIATSFMLYDIFVSRCFYFYDYICICYFSFIFLCLLYFIFSFLCF